MRPAIEQTLPKVESYWYFFELSHTQASEKDDLLIFLPQATQFKEFGTPMEYKNLTKYSEGCRPRIGTELYLLGVFHRPRAFFRTRRDITASPYLCPSAITSNALTLVIYCSWCQVICYRPQGKVMFSQTCVILSKGVGWAALVPLTFQVPMSFMGEGGG